MHLGLGLGPKVVRCFSPHAGGKRRGLKHRAISDGYAPKVAAPVAARETPGKPPAVWPAARVLPFTPSVRPARSRTESSAVLQPARSGLGNAG